MKLLKLLLTGSLMTTAAAAQDMPLDFGVASEVVRNMMSAQTGQNILSSTNLMANYRNYALEQEMAQEAARRGLTERNDVLRTIEEMRREVLIRALRTDVLRAVKPPTEEALEKEYKKLSDQLILPQAVKLDIYSISATETQLFERAKALLASSQTDVSDQLTRRKFVHVTGQIAEPWFTADQMTESIWNEILVMPIGGTEIFPDGNDVLLVKKLDERESRPMSLDESRKILTDLLMRDSQNKLWNEFVTQKAKSLGL